MKGFRTKIGIFGRINAGKSSLINALTNQDIAIVSDVPGTTTDPVSKSMELNQLPPVLKHFRQLPRKSLIKSSQLIKIQLMLSDYLFLFVSFLTRVGCWVVK